MHRSSTELPDDRPLSTTTFLFTDIEGSTRQWEESPEMHERLREHFAALRWSVESVGGEVFATLGDGIAAAFTSADAAVRAAVDAQRHMPAIGLSVRMGVHTGEVERVGHDYRGRPVNRAARIMALAAGGQVLVSDLTAALLRSRPDPVELLDLGAHRLRDLTDPEHLWQVVHPDLARHFPPLRSPEGEAHNLPAQRSSLVGREDDVEWIVALTDAHRIVTLTGVGGVGKTRLAVQAASALLPRFAKVWFVELAGVVDPDDVAAAMAHGLGASAIGDPVDAAIAMATGERSLIVLDNCEHVIERAAAVVDALTTACAELSVLATSREALGLAGEHLVAVSPLDPATTAAELFHHRAAASGADLSAADPTVVVDLCARLDGIPLAIELAAARIASLGLGAVVDGLDSRLTRGVGGRRDVGQRHSTMQATIDWSYRLLGPEEQRLFEWLAVHPSGFELDAAIHVGASLGLDPDAATDHVSSLVHKSMVATEAHPQGVRYRMLEPVRAFALDQLTDRDERSPALAALAEWVATLTGLPYADCCNAAVERNAIRLEREADSWRDAVVFAGRSGSGELAARLCGPPVAFFLLGRHDLAGVLSPLLALCGDDPLRRRAVLCALSVSAAGASDAAPLQTWADEIEACEQLEPTGLGGLMQWLAKAWQGDFTGAIDVCVRKSLDPRIAQGTRDLLVGIATLDHFSLTDATGDPHGLVDRALEVAERSDVAIHRATCLLGVAWALADPDPDGALRLVRLALADVDDVPALTRLTLPGSASRLLTRIDPRTAARSMLEQLDAAPAGGSSFVDLIPLFYAAELVDRMGHGSARTVLASITAHPVAPYRSMMDYVSLARRASSPSDDPAAIRELEATVRAALVDIVTTPTKGEGMKRETPEVQRLRSVPLFAACTTEELGLIGRNVTEHRFEAGDVLIHEGGLGREFFVIVEGEVVVTIDDHEVARVGAGGFVGEMSLLDEQARSATVVAVTDLVVLVSSHQEFAACLDIAPYLTRQLLTGVAGRLRDANGALVGSTRSSAAR